MKIAVLATEYLKKYLEDSIHSLNLDCQIEIFIFYNYEHIVELYKLIENKFDGFITTGPGPVQAIKTSINNCKPIEFFLCSEGNYYKSFLEVIYRYNDLNFEYGYFDFCDYLCPGQEKTLVNYLKNGTFKEWLEKNNEFISKLSVKEVLKSSAQKKEKHLTLWREKKIKYSLSRMSQMMPELLEAGVNCHYIYFSVNDIKMSFDKLICQILTKELQDTKIVSIDIGFLEFKNFSEEQLLLEKEKLKKLILKFMKKNLYNFITREIKYGIRITTNYKTASNLTNNFISCKLNDYIKTNSTLNTFIGYGISNEITQAEFNAQRAAKESLINGGIKSYLITENGDLVNLVEKGKDIHIKGVVSPYINEIANKTGLSTLTIQKLISALEITGTKEVTAQDIARVLHIALRNVNRIIFVLLQYNLAKILYTKQINTKGRPSNVYEFFLEIKN